MTSEPDRPVDCPDETESAGLEERIDAVERALTGDDTELTDIGDEAAAAAERETLAKRLDSVEERIEELEAATQAVRGYAGAIRSVNREVERRADLALARATEARDDGRTADTLRSEETSPSEDTLRSKDMPRSEETPRSEDMPRLDDGRSGGRGTSEPPSVEREAGSPEIPSDSAIEAAIPDDGPTADRGHGSDTPNRTDLEGGEAGENGSGGGPLERLRDAL